MVQAAYQICMNHTHTVCYVLDQSSKLFIYLFILLFFLLSLSTFLILNKPYILLSSNLMSKHSLVHINFSSLV